MNGVLVAIAEAMFSEDGEVSRARLRAHVADVRDLVSAASAPVRLGLTLALFAIALSPLLFARGLARFRTIAGLGIDDRVRVLARLERTALSPLSLAFVAWRSMMTIAFYDEPSELAALGYPGAERQRYKRSLAMAPPAPQESGVRLKDGEPATGRDSEPDAIGDVETTSAA